ncbi:hypothetical protein BDN67DRAFT_1068752 [Paxillus ammoniavirescens]|nr:hypothetical protein BDN67DRAFT_1068752 [Paxillus ammoniavirescens]
MTSVAISASSRQHAKPGVWSLNYRVGGGYSSDSDSEAETNAPPADTRALQEMDLSTRQETVEYRPNPWSIAKINAVSRASHPKLNEDKPRPRIPPNPPTKRIVEAFKKQAERNARPIQHQVAHNAGEGKKARVSDKIVIPLQSRGTPEEKHSQKLSCEGPRMISRNPMAVPRNEICVQPAEPSNHRSLRAAAPIQLSEAPPQQESTHTSTSAQSVRSKNNGTLPFMFRRVFGTRKPHSYRDLVTQSSPVRPSSPARSHAMALHVRSYIVGAGRDLPMYPHSSPGPPSPVSASELGATYVRPSLPPLASSAMVTNSQAAKTGNEHAQHTAFSSTVADLSRCTDATVVPSWLSAALSQENDPLPALVPEADRKRLPSPIPAPPRSKKPRSDAPRHLTPATPSAYAFGDDPDSKWSTLPVGRKRPNTPKPRGMKQSGGFRLPIPGLQKGNEKPTTQLMPKARQRVITYLPPPMTVKKLPNDTTLTSTNDDHKLIATEGDLPPTDPTRRNQYDQEMAFEGDPTEEDAEMPTMDSDGVTLVNDDEESVLAFDIDDVCVRYPTTRAYMKEVRSRDACRSGSDAFWSWRAVEVCDAGLVYLLSRRGVGPCLVS